MTKFARLQRDSFVYFLCLVLVVVSLSFFYGAGSDSVVQSSRSYAVGSSPHYGNLYKSGTTLSQVSQCGAGLVRKKSGGRHVLVTGVAGFIASHVARYCNDVLQMTVVGVDDLSALGNTGNVPESTTFVEGDLKDVAFVSCIFSKYGPFDVVYHIAAYGGQGMSHFIRNSLYSTNVLASVNVINQAVETGCSHFVFTSSCAVYGNTPPPLTEDAIVFPDDPYAISKYAIELDLVAAKKMFNLNYTIFRPHNVYGPGQGVNDRYRNVIGIWMRQILSGGEVTIFGDGTQQRAFTFIGDLAPLISRAPITSRAANRVINVGASRVYELKSRTPRMKFVGSRQEVSNVEPDHALAAEIFGDLVLSETSIESGMESMAAWVMKRSKQWEVDAFHVPPEVTKNMPEVWYQTFKDKGLLPLATQTVPEEILADEEFVDVEVGGFTEHKRCRFDGHVLDDFLDFGLMPLGNNFLPPGTTAEEFLKEKKFPLTVKFCPECGAVQVNVAPHSQGNVWKDYLYRSSVIQALADEFKNYASLFVNEFPGQAANSRILEVGCNDGVFLKPLAKLGAKVVGVDPATDVIEGLVREGYEAVNDFFGEKSASVLVKKYGKFDAVVSSNSFAHVDDMQDIMRGVVSVLKSNGVLAIQVHYLVSMIEGMQYDWIYHEHMSYYSLHALEKFLGRHGMQVYHAERTPMHGGSIRVYAQFTVSGTRSVDATVAEIRSLEHRLGAYRPSYLQTFAKSMEKHRMDLRAMLSKIKAEGGSIVGYGAPARATTMSGYIGFEFMKKHLEAVIDDAKSKQGHFMPGSHIPIVSSRILKKRRERPSHVLLFAWPWRKNVVMNNQFFLDDGGKYIIPLPVVQIVDRYTDMESIQ